MSAPATTGDGGPRISLVVCTRDRADRLPDFFARLAALRPAVACEIVLVDNASRDATPRLLAGFAATAALPVVLAHEPRPGLAAARNAGATAARAPLLAFIDDDCYPAPDLLDRWVDAFADASVGFGGGRVLLHDPDDAPVTIRTETTPRRFVPGMMIAPGTVHGANMAFRREALLAVGGFDPVLGPGARFNFEDLDATSRVLDAGYAGVYVPEPVVYHHHRRRDPRELARLRRSYAHGVGAYYASRLLCGTPWRHVATAFYVGLRLNGPRASARELAGGAHYLLHRLAHRPERPLAPHGATRDACEPAALTSAAAS